MVWAGGFFHGWVYVGTLCEGLAREPFVRRARYRPKQGLTHKPAHASLPALQERRGALGEIYLPRLASCLARASAE